MIRVTVSEVGLKVMGHANNEACARISTVFQVTCVLLEKKIKNKKEQTGVSIVEFENLTKAEEQIYGKIIVVLDELATLYPSRIRLEVVEND